MSPMSRLAFWAEIGNVSVVEPMLLNAYQIEEERIWRRDLDSDPHGAHWHTSFHVSSFPGDNPYACGRLAVYTLMNPPAAEPHKPETRAMFDIGKDLELNWIRRFASYGVLLSADQTAGDTHQTGFKDDEHMLTGSPDAIVLPPHWTRGHCVEVKTTAHEKVISMREGGKPPYSHEKYRRQLRGYIGLAHEIPFAPLVIVCMKSGVLMGRGHDKRCPHRHEGECEPRILQLEPPEDGTLIYSSREEPLTTMSYFESYDPAYMQAGRDQLARWRDDFLNDRIPDHPRAAERAKWSVDPCRFCDLKKNVCKPDFTDKITRLSDSHLTEFARSIRPEFDPTATREAVLARWGLNEQEESAA